MPALLARLTPTSLAPALGASLLLLLAAGPLDAAHRESLEVVQRYSTAPSPAHQFRYDLPGERPTGYYVGFGDWAQHRVFHFTRVVAGAGLAMLLLAGIAARLSRVRR